MSIRGIFELEGPNTEDINPKDLLTRSVLQASPALAWRFDRARYGADRLALEPSGEFRPFDYASDTQVTELKETPTRFWDFVRSECEYDTSPEPFGEAVRIRYVRGSTGRCFGRLQFNHGLVDGLQIFAFLRAWRRALGTFGANLRPVGLPDADETRWKTGEVEFYVRDLHPGNCRQIAEHGSDYHSALRQLVRDHRFKIIRQVVATPRNARLQLTLASVPRLPGSNTAFRRRNRAIVGRAARGTLFNTILGLSVSDPAKSDRMYRRLLEYPRLSRPWLRVMSGGLLVSAFGFRDSCILAFPVAHASQPEAVAICNMFEGHHGPTVRLTGVRNLNA